VISKTGRAVPTESPVDSILAGKGAQDQDINAKSLANIALKGPVGTARIGSQPDP
jgi:hypothetical protein